MLRRKLLDNYKEQNNSKKIKIENKDVHTNSTEISPYFKHELLNNQYNVLYNSSNSVQSDTSTETFQDLLNVNIENVEFLDPYTQNCDEQQFVLPCIEDRMLNLQVELNHVLNNLNLKIPLVEYIYNPLEYAFNTYEMYIRKYCCSTKKILLVGLNPGPFGMCQTGVPFGDPECVKEFLQIEGIVCKPNIECPVRPILGFSSSRREPSGHRLWNFFKSICHRPEFFFNNAFIFNFCPLALMDGKGRNVTPADIKDIKVRKNLESPCEVWYLKVIDLLKPEYIIAIGTYIHKKTKYIFKANNIDNIKLLCMPHPSPRAVNNQNWHEKAEKFMIDNNLMHYFCD